jgi:hypothetical protein
VSGVSHSIEEQQLKNRGHMSTTSTSGTSGNARRYVTLAWSFFVGTFVAILVSGIWSLFVGTASMGADEEDLVRGWAGVLRNLPGYALPVTIASLGIIFSVKAVRSGEQRGRKSLIGTSIALLAALQSVTRDSAEVVMTTRAATMSWILFAVDVLVVACVFFIARRLSSTRAQS